MINEYYQYDDDNNCISCLRRDMPAHASDFSLHMQGLFQTLLVQQDTISELCNSQCDSAVDELAREIAYPLYEMLETNLDDIGLYLNNSDLHRRLSIIWALMPMNEVMNSDYDDDNDNSNDLSDIDFSYHHLPALPVATALGIKERRRNNRIYLLNHTPCAKLLSNILSKSELFTEAQLKMTLSVLRALFFTNGGTPGFGFEVSLEDVRFVIRLLFPFQNLFSIVVVLGSRTIVIHIFLISCTNTSRYTVLYNIIYLHANIYYEVK